MKAPATRIFPTVEIKGGHYIKANRNFDFESMFSTGHSLEVIYPDEQHEPAISLPSERNLAAFPVEINDFLSVNVVEKTGWKTMIYKIVDFNSNGKAVGRLAGVSKYSF